MQRISEQLRLLADRAASIEVHAEAAQAEAAEKRDQKVADARARLKEQQGEFSARVSAMSDDSQAAWTGVEKSLKGTRDKLRSKAKESAHALEQKDARHSADWAEDYAYDSVQFALLAVAEADAAVVEAIATRAYADALATAQGA